MPDPHHSNDILQYTLAAANALRDVSTATQIPFLKSVCSLSVSIIPLIKVKMTFRKDRCLPMLEDVHCVLCALMALCLHSENISSAQMLHQIARYAETLQKLYACLRAQSELGRIKRVFKQNEITAQLDLCTGELKAASEIFTTQCGVGVANALLQMNSVAEKRHQELLELISTRNGSFTTASSVVTLLDQSKIHGSSFNNSSGSLSLLPASPKIFHGRDSELNDLVGVLLKDSPRVAILGPGGMGKTTLAMAALHHAAIIEKYNLRHFISCESTNTEVDLVSTIGSHLGLEPARQLSQAILRHLRESGPCLLVLDNFETPWEPAEYRGGVESFLSLLADIPTLALMLTMRGAERPAKVKWNRPFLPPLEPLEPSASRQIFCEVADEPESIEQPALDELLVLSGNLPLAVSLMASIASFEGYNNTLSRWKSPLSPLNTPDGITEEEITVSKVPLPHVAQCRASLVRTSLAYVDVHGRLKALSPIREFMRMFHPPAASLSKPLRKYFQDLLALWESYRQLPSGGLAPKIMSCLGNINDLILHGLVEDQDTWQDIAHSILTLNTFSRIMLKGHSQLIQKLPGLIEATGDSRFRWSYACAYLRNEIPPVVGSHADILIVEGYHHYHTVQHHIAEVKRTNNSSLRGEIIFMKLSTMHALGDLDGKGMLGLVHEVGDLTTNGLAEHRLSWLCEKANDLAVANGIEESGRHITILDAHAEIDLRKSEYTQAREIQAVVASKTSPNSFSGYHANALANLAYLDILRSSDEVGIFRNIERAKAVYISMGSPRILVCSWLTAELHLSRGDTQTACALFEECLSKSRGIYPDIPCLCLAALGDPRQKMYNQLDSFRWALVYLAFVRRSRDMTATLHALRCLADVSDDETALNLYNTALQGATEIDIHRLRAESMTGIGDIMMRQSSAKPNQELLTEQAEDPPESSKKPVFL
ncbi:hypothetical protein B0H17DRAFT_1269560 [Mycena rosella]|uniref:NB-ARC domain-containing protein n=1 Tax=Mycena rosella TaxID=1033263 RepID=A0AAD7CLK4_MYCRO|nr:hypothetical protein B0H17DRAFT_1269560 [Mycena rosella]